MCVNMYYSNISVMKIYMKINIFLAAKCIGCSKILIHVSNEQFVYKCVGSISHVTTLFYKLASF